jgi:3-hydroxyisobutyrate dehydrogenase
MLVTGGIQIMSKPSVALLGIGTMGMGMAGRLLGAGFPLAVYNRRGERAEPLAEQGARLAVTPRHAAANSRVIISMLADDSASRSVWLGEEGALGGAPSGAVLVESGTVSVGWVKELAAAAEQKHCLLLDAPVTGSKHQAEAGELNFLVGGGMEALSAARPVLEVMSKTILHLGPTGSGAMVKLINNFVCGVQAASLAEAVALIERSGMNLEKALGVLTHGAPGSPLLKVLAARMTARDYTPNFFMKLMAKDLGYAMSEGHSHSMDLQTASAAAALFRRAIAAGLADQDFSAVVEPLREHG